MLLLFGPLVAAAAALPPRLPSQVHLSLTNSGGAADWDPVVGWRSSAPPGDAIVQFGRAANSLTQNASAEFYTTHPGMDTGSFPFVTLRGLEPDTTYFYRVGSPAGAGPGSGFSRIFNMTTPPVSRMMDTKSGGAKPTPAWSFLAYGDLGTSPSDHEDELGQDVRCSTNTTVNADCELATDSFCLPLLCDESPKSCVFRAPGSSAAFVSKTAVAVAAPGCPDVTLRQLRRREWDGARPGLRHELVLHVGDIVYADYGCNLSTNVAWWDLFGEQTEFMAASKPYLICPGNHDLHARASKDAQGHIVRTSDLESLRYNARYRMPPREGASAGPPGNSTTAGTMPVGEMLHPLPLWQFFFFNGTGQERGCQ